MSTVRYEVRKFKVADLKESPYQRDLVGDVSEAKLNALIDSMEKDGQLEPVKLLSDLELVDGHQRLRAAKALGWEEIDGIILHDLEEKGEAAIKITVLVYNLIRRQMDPLAIGRGYRALKENESNQPFKTLGKSDRKDVRDRIAGILGLGSGRTLDRYEKMLDTPVAIQEAFSRGELTQTAVLKFAKLSSQKQEAAAQELLAGVPAKQVTQKYLGTTKARAKRAKASDADAETGTDTEVGVATDEDVEKDFGSDSDDDLEGDTDADEVDDDDEVAVELERPCYRLNWQIQRLVSSDLATSLKEQYLDEATEFINNRFDMAERHRTLPRARRPLASASDEQAVGSV